MNRASVPPALLPEALHQHTAQQLSQAQLWYGLPAPLDQLYLRYRQQAFRSSLAAAWPVLLGLQALIAVVGWVQFQPDLHGADGRAWWGMIALSAAIYCVLIPACHHRLVAARYEAIVAIALSLQIASQLGAAMVVHDPHFAQALTYACMISDFTIMLGWQLSPVAGALSCLGGLLLAGSLMASRAIHPDWPLVLAYQGGAVFNLLVVALVLARADRIGFLQGVLLQQDTLLREQLSQRLDEQNRQLQQIVQIDALTGLANRRHFDHEISREWDRLRLEGESLALLFIDVDHFKYYNDHYGHGGGDQCLSAVCAVLQQAAQRPADLCARYGGEEFVVVLPGTDSQGARCVAERILRNIDVLAMPHARSPVAGHVTVSIGYVAMVPTAASSVAALLKAADAALYVAKQEGRHRAHAALPEPI